MKIGIIADDFTGATDIASFLVENGLSAIQFNGIPTGLKSIDTDAVVISLKSRSIAKEEAIAESLAALKWLQAQDCEQVYFKYCSTFDSTKEGNIGPVTDALLAAMGEKMTIISPALPVNGRTVYKGYLFVLDELLADSPMRNHPLNPMRDSSLLRLMDAQAEGKTGLITSDELDKGTAFVKARLSALSESGIRYVVMDALTEAHLLTQGEAVKAMKLVTGGSGLAIGLAKAHQTSGGNHEQAKEMGYPVAGKAIVLSGSCSAMTNKQVAHYQEKAPSFGIEVAKVVGETDRKAYVDTILQWLKQQESKELAPLIYATSDPANLAEIQARFGAETASLAVESTFKQITEALRDTDFTRFIIAGGETSGVVTQALGIESFYIGPMISPGVPWVKGVEKAISLTLKSGNFGDEDFFARAQKEFPV